MQACIRGAHQMRSIGAGYSQHVFARETGGDRHEFAATNQGSRNAGRALLIRVHPFVICHWFNTRINRESMRRAVRRRVRRARGANVKESPTLWARPRAVRETSKQPTRTSETSPATTSGLRSAACPASTSRFDRLWHGNFLLRTDARVSIDGPGRTSPSKSRRRRTMRFMLFPIDKRRCSRTTGFMLQVPCAVSVVKDELDDAARPRRGED